MPVQLYSDHNVHFGIVKGLRQRGVDIIIALEDDHHKVDDSIVIERVTELNRVIFTQDRDFLEIAAGFQRQGRHFSGVIYAHQLKVSIGDCIRDLEIIAKAGNPEDFKNQVLHLPL